MKGLILAGGLGTRLRLRPLTHAGFFMLFLLPTSSFFMVQGTNWCNG